jgi:hypothetical protein
MEDSFKTKGSKWAFEDLENIHRRIDFETNEIFLKLLDWDQNTAAALRDDLEKLKKMFLTGYIYPLVNQLLRVAEKLDENAAFGEFLTSEEAQFMLNEIRALRYDGFNSAPALGYLSIETLDI